MTLDTAVFFVSAIVAVFGATMMIVQRNPVASVLYLIVSLVAQAVLYIQLGTVFMAAVLVIVYAGAILVLFLFVIMLLNLRGQEDLSDNSQPLSRLTKYFVSGLLFVELWFAVKSGLIGDVGGRGVTGEFPDTFGSVEQIAVVLFTKYLYPFELTSVLILAAIVGAVVIARRERDDLPISASEVADRSIADEVKG
ncbi:MAG TPA: NADH-quinone oxidoreductase subunit J [Candidatus Deferrimicrobium sp.]|nr:NADH-quinone oxidoreductase subunit J [Candidatus Deferrimicrobium sp.]